MSFFIGMMKKEILLRKSSISLIRDVHYPLSCLSNNKSSHFLSRSVFDMDTPDEVNLRILFSGLTFDFFLEYNSKEIIVFKRWFLSNFSCNKKR